MSSFRVPVQISRPAAGSYVNGVWVAGTDTTFTIRASVQPVSGEDQITLPGDYLIT
jgi:hypothetical protein